MFNFINELPLPEFFPKVRVSKLLQPVTLRTLVLAKDQGTQRMHNTVTELALYLDLTETCLSFGLLTAQMFISCGIWAT